MKLKKPHLLVAGVALLAVIQVVPVAHTNPPVEAEVAASPEVKAILRRACYDCHSNETVWGWQTYVAPVSWLVAHDVSEGREELNVSRWGQMEPGKKARLAKKIQEEVGSQEMPPLLYRVAHPASRLTEAEREAIAAWARSL